MDAYEQLRMIGESFTRKVMELDNVQSMWIPVAERLPEESGAYLVTITSSYSDFVTRAECYKDEDGALSFDDCIIAWMPLPEPYKPEQTEV